ncbi:hypothetical protein CC1G_15268 [Coprinopsis cinerea okayama7|uniref:Uncharacterized protein n=1 Tax=Coprinopsis cinerea (strain Okayama-7 / 130 / ATCC MYA-4618 / FGSC 9003) TaxID=240176 RepID=D6RPW7_COPC7|nr:hypothetical protein CC1G_15268 [Coprinopsis cinerea okayama7\|eukprot:XP_002910360.1 hypothetical protein CC1G_15268 [Coprinopsis cinerea okayama7\
MWIPPGALASSTGGVKSQNSADRISPSEIGYKAGKSNFSRKVRPFLREDHEERSSAARPRAITKHFFDTGPNVRTTVGCDRKNYRKTKSRKVYHPPMENQTCPGLTLEEPQSPSFPPRARERVDDPIFPFARVRATFFMPYLRHRASIRSEKINIVVAIPQDAEDRPEPLELWCSSELRAPGQGQRLPGYLYMTLEPRNGGEPDYNLHHRNSPARWNRIYQVVILE